MPTTSAVPRARVPSSTTAGSAISGIEQDRGCLVREVADEVGLGRRQLGVADRAGPSVVTAFMLLRWSAATMSMRQAAVEIAVMPRRSRVVSGFMVPPEWVGVGGQQARGHARRAERGFLPPGGDGHVGQDRRAGPAHARHGGPAAGERGRRRGRDLGVHGRDEPHDLVVAVAEDGGEDLRRGDVVGAEGEREHAVVVARAGDLDPARGEGALVGDRHDRGVEPVAAVAVANAQRLQGAAQEEAGLQARDEHVLARHDMAYLVDEVLGQPGPGRVAQRRVDHPQQHFGRAHRDVVALGGDRAVGLGRDEVVVARDGEPGTRERAARRRSGRGRRPR